MTAERTSLPQALGQPGVRVHTLLSIRWMSVAGQALTLIVVSQLLGFALPVFAVAAAVGAAALLNLGLLLIYRRGARITGAEAFSHLAFDLVQLAALLYLTGGLTNPFCILLLVPVTISATLLSSRTTVALIALALGIIVLLFLWHRPLPWSGVPPLLPATFLVGLAIALGFTLSFLAIYALNVAADGRRWQQALVATEAALERETKMSALGALAAAAAHELGGPLGTIRLVAADLAGSLGNDATHGEDVRLLAAEAKRSGEILAGIAQRAEAEEPFAALTTAAVLHEAAQPYEGGRVHVVVDHGNAARIPITRSPELVHGLANLVDNAVRHAAARVTLSARANASHIALVISDDGPGFPPDILARLGEPYLGPSVSQRGGTGLGIFIATTLLERTRARVTFSNGEQGGAVVTVTWPRDDIEAPRLMGE